MNDARKRAWKRVAGCIATVTGLAIAMLPMRASPAASVSGHGTVLLLALIPAAAVVTIGILLLDTGRVIVATIAAALFVCVAVLHPVSDRIPDEDVANFETVISLDQRSARGEPFRHMDGHWYQVKPWIARALFF